MGALEDVVPLGLRRYHLPAGFARGSCGVIRTYSPRILFRGPVLCRQVFGVRRRDVGEKPRSHRGRDRGGAALSEERAKPNRPGHSLDGGAAISISDRTEVNYFGLFRPSQMAEAMTAGIGQCESPRRPRFRSARHDLVARRFQSRRDQRGSRHLPLPSNFAVQRHAKFATSKCRIVL
jgi:hypothetical protein